MNVQNKIVFFIIFLLVVCNLCFAEDSVADKRLLFVRNKNIWVYDLASTKEYELIENADNPSCSPDGKQVAFTRDYNVWIVTLPKGKETRITDFKSSFKGEIKNLDWAVYKDYIVFERNELYELQSKEDRHPVIWPEGELEPRSRTFTLSSIWLAKKGEIAKKFIGYTGYGSATVGTHLGQVEAPSWSPDGKKIAFSRNGDIWIVKVETLEDKIEERIMSVAYLENTNGSSPSSKGMSKISWSSDGKKFVFSISRMYGSGTGEIWIADSDGSNSKKISSKGYEQWPIFLGEKVIAFSDGHNVRTMNIDGSNESELLHNAIKPCLCPGLP